MGESAIELDGSAGEGGGQILRSSLSLSLLTGKEFHLRNVRARRSRPGLQPQHLTSVRAAAEVGQAHVVGAKRGSTDLIFTPGRVLPGRYRFPIGTAGSTTLVLQTLYLPLMLRAETTSDIVIEGGTHNDHSPCFHFLNTTWKRYMQLLGLNLDVIMRRPGFYPRGGGVIGAQLSPCARIGGLRLLERSTVGAVTGFSAVAGLPAAIAERQARRARQLLKATGLKVNIEVETWDSGPGTVLALQLDTQPAPTLFFALGARGKRAEQVANEAVAEVLDYLRTAPAAVDAHSADQLLLPLSFAEESSHFSVTCVTQHLLTNLDVIKHFVDRDLNCDGNLGESGTVGIS